MLDQYEFYAYEFRTWNEIYDLRFLIPQFELANARNSPASSSFQEIRLSNESSYSAVLGATRCVGKMKHQDFNFRHFFNSFSALFYLPFLNCFYLFFALLIFPPTLFFSSPWNWINYYLIKICFNFFPSYYFSHKYALLCQSSRENCLCTRNTIISISLSIHSSQIPAKSFKCVRIRFNFYFLRDNIELDRLHLKLSTATD